MIRISVVVFLCSVILQPLHAQVGATKFLIHGSYSIPTGKFGETLGDGAELTNRLGFDPGDDVGLAKPGFGLGLEFSNTVLTDGLDWLISAKWLVNPTDVAGITDEFEDELGDTVDVEYENGNWINIPIFTGFKYTLHITDDVGIFGSLQAGLNITRQASRTAIVEGSVVEQTTFKFLANFGLEAGVGFELYKRYHLGFRYLNLGQPQYAGTRTMDPTFFPEIPRREMPIEGDQRSVRMFLIVLGYHI